MVSVLGFSFAGQGQNAALAFITLKEWSERTEPGSSAQALAGRAFGALSGIRDAFIFPLSPAPIPELGSSSGFSFRLQERGSEGLQGTEMWLSIVYLLADIGGAAPALGYRPQGVHRPDPAWTWSFL